MSRWIKGGTKAAFTVTSPGNWSRATGVRAPTQGGEGNGDCVRYVRLIRATSCSPIQARRLDWGGMAGVPPWLLLTSDPSAAIRLGGWSVHGALCQRLQLNHSEK